MTSSTTSSPDEQTKGLYDVAIVGGGIAGLYAAYRLRQIWKADDEAAREQLSTHLKLAAGRTLRVVILEENPLELGGRVRAVKLPFPGGAVTAEVGPMRFTTRQKLVRRLLDDLGIRTMPFKGEGFDTSYFLRGKHFSDDDVKSGKSPYNLQNTSERPEQNKHLEELVQMVFDNTVKELSIDSASYTKITDDPKLSDTEKTAQFNKAYLSTLRALEKLRDKILRETLTHEEWLEIQDHCLLRGKIHLRDIGLWNLLHHYLSPDGAKLVEDGFGYESVLGNWNLSDAIPWFIDDFSLGQSYEAVEKGFGDLIVRLKAALTNSEEEEKHQHPFASEMFLNTRVREIGFDPRADLYSVLATTTALRYEHQNDDDRVAASKESDAVKKAKELTWWQFSARAVILAIPKEPLSKLHVADLLSDWSSDDGKTTKELNRVHKRKWLADLDTVRAHRLAKLVQAFRTPWWRSPERAKGAGELIITDLPLRQIYYWDQEWLEKRGRYEFYVNGNVTTDAPVRQPGIGGIIVAYLDGHYVSYWRFITTVQRLNAHLETYREDEDGLIEPRETDEEKIIKRIKCAETAEGKRIKCFGDRIWGWSDRPEISRRRWEDDSKKGNVARMREFYGRLKEEEPSKRWTDQERVRYLYFRKHGLFARASDKMTHILKDLHESLKNGHKVTPEPPVVGAYMFWDNFGDEPIPEAGWHTWEPGANSEVTMEEMSRPFRTDDGHNEKKHRVFVCGEAYSSEQGWIEGALKSVERLVDKLGVRLPGDVCKHVGVCKKEHDHPEP